MGIVDKLPRPSYLPVKSVLNLYDKEMTSVTMLISQPD